MDIKILVATHKKYRMPQEDIYLPVEAGRKIRKKTEFTGDDTGDNISAENPRFCELTAVYWAWKNMKSEYIGLVHYRRHFTTASIFKRMGKDKFRFVIKKKELEEMLKDCDMILPQKRKYYIESIYSHFIHLPYTFKKDLEILRNVIAEKEPEYLSAFDKVMERKYAHMFNMFIMKKEIFDSYCKWMFPLLFEADRRIDVSEYTTMEARAVAYFGEFMIDIWNEKNKIPYKETGVIFMEKQNWIIKGGKFILRKFGKR